jgi:hypothetical protein
MIAKSGHPEGTVRRRQVIEELRAGIRFSGLQDWLPALVPTVAPLDLFAGLQQVVVLPDDLHAALRDHEASTLRRYDLLDPDERPLVPPSERFVSATEVLAAARRGAGGARARA